jgi:hypothetical protein
MRDFKGATRVERIKVERLEVVDGACEDIDALLRELALVAQRVKNRFYKAFVRWHEDHGSAAAVAAWMDQHASEARRYSRAMQDWQEADRKTRGKKPKRKIEQCPSKPFPPACGKAIYAATVGREPSYHTKLTGAIVQRETGDLSQRKASRSAYKRWHRILADLGEMPTFSRPQPVPFSPSHSRIERHEDGKDVRWSIRVAIASRAAGPLVLRLWLWTRGRKTKKNVPILEKALAYQEQTQEELAARRGRKNGDPSLAADLAEVESRWLGTPTVKFGASAIQPQGAGWEVMLCYREEKDAPIEVDPSKTAVLIAGRRRPWVMRIDGQKRCAWVMGRGRLVGRIRMKYAALRASRNESARYGSRSRKGHGRRRAVYDVKNGEDHFKKTFNAQAVAAVLRLLESHGVGRLIYRGPKARREKGTTAETRFLVTAGATPRRPGLWNWHQFKTMLEQKAQDAGVELLDKSKKSEEKRPKPKRAKKMRNNR